MLALVRYTELTPPEQRVLGCLLEKRYTTPDQYPLSLNALRLACNQSTNRNPVTEYDEGTVREAAQRLCKRGLARLVSGHTSRTVKYRHLAEEALGLDRAQLAVLTVLLLRGPQTPGELKARTERMAQFASLSELEAVLVSLGERDFARRVARRPGQKEDRFEHLLGEEVGMGGPSVAAASPDFSQTAAPAAPVGMAPAPDRAGGDEHPAATRTGSSFAPDRPRPAGKDGSAGFAPPSPVADLGERVRALEAQVAALREELAALRDDP